MSNKTKIAFIINPIAGRRKHHNIVKVLKQGLGDVWKPLFLETQYSGHAGELVLEHVARGVKYFVAVGGDGTVSEVATSVFKSGAKMGIIPCGSGNGLARTLKIPLRIDKAVAALNPQKLKKIDVGTINEHYFFCTCGVGFDAKVGRKFAKQETRGLRTYVKTTLQEYFNYNAKKYKLKIDGTKVNKRAFLITFANAGQYGNNAYIAPNAKIDDGILDICIFKPFPLYRSLGLGLRLFMRNIDKSRYLEIIQGRTIVLKRKNKKVPFHIDGDPVKLVEPVQIDIIPRALEIMVP
jgi:diacylglycerol kinase (ATP)